MVPSLLSQSLMFLVCHLHEYSVESLSLLPLSMKCKLLYNLSPADICKLEQTSFCDGIETDSIWRYLLNIKCVSSSLWQPLSPITPKERFFSAAADNFGARPYYFCQYINNVFGISATSLILPFNCPSGISHCTCCVNCSTVYLSRFNAFFPRPTDVYLATMNNVTAFLQYLSSCNINLVETAIPVSMCDVLDQKSSYIYQQCIPDMKGISIYCGDQTGQNSHSCKQFSLFFENVDKFEKLKFVSGYGGGFESVVFFIHLCLIFINRDLKQVLSKFPCFVPTVNLTTNTCLTLRYLSIDLSALHSYSSEIPWDNLLIAVLKSQTCLEELKLCKIEFYPLQFCLSGLFSQQQFRCLYICNTSMFHQDAFTHLLLSYVSSPNMTMLSFDHIDVYYESCSQDVITLPSSRTEAISNRDIPNSKCLHFSVCNIPENAFSQLGHLNQVYLDHVMIVDQYQLPAKTFLNAFSRFPEFQVGSIKYTCICKSVDGLRKAEAITTHSGIQKLNIEIQIKPATVEIDAVLKCLVALLSSSTVQITMLSLAQHGGISSIYTEKVKDTTIALLFDMLVQLPLVTEMGIGLTANYITVQHIELLYESWERSKLWKKFGSLSVHTDLVNVNNVNKLLEMCATLNV